MDAVHLHLLSNHVPIIGAFLGAVVLVVGMIRKSPPTLAAAYWVFIIAAVVGLAAYFSGEGAEEAVEHLPGVSHDIIEAHEDIAKFTLIAMGLLGGLSIFGLLRSKNHFDNIKTLATVILLVAIASFGVGVYTGLTGGQIRHTEVRSSAPGVSQPPAEMNDND